jgi:hypothetical protein
MMHEETVTGDAPVSVARSQETLTLAVHIRAGCCHFEDSDPSMTHMFEDSPLC